MALSISTAERFNNVIGDGGRAEVVTRLNGNICTDAITCGAVTASGTATLTGSVVRTSFTCISGTRAKVGAGAGWVVAAGANTPPLATMAQSQTAGTLVIPIDGLHIGDTITGFTVTASINSAGGAVTLDANLRSYTFAAAATAVDASIGSITQISVTAATAATATKSGLSTVVATGTQYYILLTGTTAASTTIELNTIEFTVTTS